MKAIGLIMFLITSILGIEITPSLNNGAQNPSPYVYEETAEIIIPAEDPGASENPGTAAPDTKSLAQCLTEGGAKLYTAFWCGHCQNQKAMFGENLQYLAYYECDARGENADPQACADAGITAFPTWILGDGTKLIGTQSLETLAAETSC